MFNKIFFFSILLFCVCINNIQSATPQVVMECPGLKSFREWCGGEHKTNNIKSCIMISIPKSKKGVPQYKSRGEVYLTIYHNPSDQNIGVIYITTGYTYKKNSIVKVKIDNNKEHDFNVLEGDTAFTDDENVDKKLVLEMKKGNKMQIIGFSSRGTKTTDIYSLSGFSAAYKHISNLCNVN